MATALILGDFSFQNWEVPERINDFGGYQKLVKHDFPGGDIDIQTFGYFPVESIKWSGQFWPDDLIISDAGTAGQVGPQQASIYDRINGLKAMCRLGNPVNLSFGEHSYSVLIHRFVVLPELELHQPYEIELVPLQDNNAVVGPPVAPNSIAPISQLASGLGNAPGAQQAGLTPPPIAPEPVVTFPTSAGPPLPMSPSVINQQPTPSLTIPVPAPQNIADDLTTFQSSLLAAIQQSNGQLSQVNNPVLQSQLNQVLADAVPLIDLSGADLTGQSAFGQAIFDSTTLINQQLKAPTAFPVGSINRVNPDLTSLAQQFYGDASQWDKIAAANVYPDGSPILTPRPIGIFQLTIPPLTTPIGG